MGVARLDEVFLKKNITSKCLLQYITLLSTDIKLFCLKYSTMEHPQDEKVLFSFFIFYFGLVFLGLCEKLVLQLLLT